MDSSTTGLAAYQRGEYFASVATLLPQVEGVINDILDTLGATIRVGNKFYEKNADGSRGRALGGLASKKQVVENKTDLDTDLASFLTAYLVPQRNAILHGAEVTYGDAERSIHILLVLLCIAVTVTSLETTAANGSGVTQGS